MKYGICIKPAAERSLSLSYSASISIGRDCKTPIEGQCRKKTNKCNQQCVTECALTRPCKSARSLSLSLILHPLAVVIEKHLLKDLQERAYSFSLYKNAATL